METTDRMEPPPLVLCAIESAARIYPDRPVVYFMKGLGNITTQDEEDKARQNFPSLSSFPNVYFFPLRMEELFNKTPLISWFQKVDPKKERYWIHVLSDACRFSLVWRYGGIYMDTDIISVQPIPKDHFVAPQNAEEFSSGVFGLSPNHDLAWEFMENFVQNYRGEVWGYQGPGVVTRVLKKECKDTKISMENDVICGNLTYLKPERFYPISYYNWKRYFEVWDNLPTFNKSYGLHLWNFLNNDKKTMEPGSNTLVEHLYKNNCPFVYRAELEKTRNESLGGKYFYTWAGLE
ncbi:alpha-1,4-N-acetylglucosaminyltransferase-like [Hyperolius riggenbachi]|uniref:alpha-1,4-N-acetylglucosaminyltransferase-like n=1 Tax=Hyperolius riggenbachi TaxID=752182 RepID=UPI0035A3D5E3